MTAANHSAPVILLSFSERTKINLYFIFNDQNKNLERRGFVLIPFTSPSLAPGLRCPSGLAEGL